MITHQVLNILKSLNINANECLFVQKKMNSKVYDKTTTIAINIYTFADIRATY